VQKLLVTGSSGLIGSEVVRYFSSLGAEVHGVDNNMRERFFGPDGSTHWNRDELVRSVPRYRHHEVDIRDGAAVAALVEELRPDAVIHAAAQPSHDRAADIPLIDFAVNAGGTLNLLEAFRASAPEAPFIFLSTNKVYGDMPNTLAAVEEETRWEFAGDLRGVGIDESMSIDRSMHSLFGVSKASADLYVQEYGRYFGMPTVCLRGGCLTGPTHSGVELHGFLSYLVKCNVTGSPYSVFGYEGKQVRDNIHSLDVARFIEQFIAAPRSAAVYNIGGGYKNSVSLVEAMRAVETRTGRAMEWTYNATNRKGDHRVYYSDLSRISEDYPNWSITVDLDTIFDDLVAGWSDRLAEGHAEHA
jgi:CDP-paratose 2-epimerase